MLAVNLSWKVVATTLGKSQRECFDHWQLVMRCPATGLNTEPWSDEEVCCGLCVSHHRLTTQHVQVLRLSSLLAWKIPLKETSQRLHRPEEECRTRAAAQVVEPTAADADAEPVVKNASKATPQPPAWTDEQVRFCVNKQLLES